LGYGRMKLDKSGALDPRRGRFLQEGGFGPATTLPPILGTPCLKIHDLKSQWLLCSTTCICLDWYTMRARTSTKLINSTYTLDSYFKKKVMSL
jgi:hypothetical protein